MRITGFVSIVLLLTLVGRPVIAEDGGLTDRRVGVARGDHIDLGTATLGHLEVAAGPLMVAVGAFDRIQVGTWVAPWFVWTVAPGSVVSNGFAKVRVLRAARLSVALRTAVFHARLDDLDGDGLDVRAWIWPSTLIVGADWTSRLSSSVEVTGVFADVAAQTLAETDTRVEGVALARSLHLGLIPRFEATGWLTAFVRWRMLLGHSPVVARAESQLSERTRIEIAAQTDAAELTSGVAGVVGMHVHWPWFSASIAGGRGTWFLPWIQLPVGDSTWIGEFDVYFRF